MSTLGNLAPSPLLKALDDLYERGANDAVDRRRFDARGCREYQAVLDVLEAEASVALCLCATPDPMCIDCGGTGRAS